jgi:hypothetical protein
MQKNQIIVFNQGNEGVIPIEIATATARRNGYHTKAKIISPELAAKVLVQKDFLPGLSVIGPAHDVGSNSLGNLMDQFLESKFFNLKDLGISVLHNSEKDQLEENIIAELIEDSNRNNLGGQAISIQDEFKSLQATKGIFQFVKKCAENNEFDERHIMLLSSVGELCDKLRTDQKAVMLSSLADICNWNDLAGRFRVPMAIDSKYLVEIFTACPVWYMEGEGVSYTNGQDDPDVDAFTQHICNVVGKVNFADFFQLYNRRNRSFSDFKGPDIMPAHIVKVLPELKKQFDYLVIATPYHDQASQEWANPAWIGSLDPYLIGFNKDTPNYAILIDRWSGSGLLPLMADMIADTMDHIQKHLNLLSNFKSNTYWYRPGIDGCTLGNGLTDFGRKVLSEFESGDLFNFLREK